MFKKFSLLLILSVLISLPVFVLAGGAGGFTNQEGTSGKIENPLNANSFTELINKLAGWIFALAIPLATLMFMVGGFQFLVSGGSEEKVTKAKKTMLWSAIGLIVCLIGAGFTNIIEELFGI